MAEDSQGAERSPAELERAGREALGRPVTAQASNSRVDPVDGSRHAAAPEPLRAADMRPKGDRGAAEIEAEIEQARDRLAVTLDEIVDRVKPANVARRTADQVRAQFVDPDTGQPRKERLMPLVGGAAGLVVLVVLFRRRGRARHRG